MLINNNFVLAQLTSDPVGEEGKIYYNTSTNKVRYYDGSTWQDLGGGTGTLGIPWWHDSGVYSVYDNFNGYSLGDFEPQVGTKWIWTPGSYGSVAVVAADDVNGEGGSGYCVAVRNHTEGASGTCSLTTGADFPTNKTAYWMRCSWYWSQADTSSGGSCSFGFSAGGTGGGGGTIQSYSSGESGTVTANAVTDLYVFKNGSTWDAYIGSRKVVTGMSSVTSLGISITIGSGHQDAYLRIDDVRYID